MEDSWLENVLSLISVELKDGHTDTIENLSDEMREDYLLSVKKAIGECNCKASQLVQIFFAFLLVIIIKVFIYIKT